MLSTLSLYNDMSILSQLCLNKTGKIKMEKGNCWALLFLHTGFLDIPVGLVKTITERQT